MSLKSHLIATCFSLTRPSSGNCSSIETAALHQFVYQCFPCNYISSFALKCVCLRMNTLSSLCVIFILQHPCYAPFMCSSHLSAMYPLWMVCVALEKEMSEEVIHQCNRMLKYNVTDLINALPDNSSVNTVQHATIDQTVFPMSSALSSGGSTGLCNPFLSNGSVNTLQCWQWRHTTVDGDHVTCSLCGPCRGYITRFPE
jgi:hypothetical protein